MNIQRFDDEAALSAALATHVLELIVARPSLVLGLPTGRTPLGLYRELRERSGGDLIDWSRAVVDSSHVPAVLGGSKPARARSTGARAAPSTS